MLTRPVAAMLIGSTVPRGTSPDAATRSINGHAVPTPVRLVLGLDAARGAEHHYGQPRTPDPPLAAQLRAAAAAVATIGDILASHLDPGRRPRTAEGVALRQGAGIADGLADVAAMTRTALQVDAHLQHWLHGSGYAVLYRPVAAICRWSSDGPLDGLCRRIVEAGQHPGLLHGLQPAAVAERRTRIVDSLPDALATFDAATAWMIQHPGHVRAAHLHEATRLAMVALITAHGMHAQPTGVTGWRSAAIAGKPAA
jgi:hypothetical protein